MLCSCHKDEEEELPWWSASTWLVQESCDNNFSHQYTLRVKAAPVDSANRIILFNIGSMDNYFGLNATLNSDSFLIHPQSVLGFIFSGSGSISNTKDSIFIQWEGGPNGICSAIGIFH